MRSQAIALFVLTVLGCCLSRASADEREIRGRIVDTAGRPVGDADVAPFWRANGSSVKADGSDYDLSKPDEHAAYWGNVGRMEPMQARSATSTSDGTFSILCHERTLALVVMDRARRLGAIAIVPESKAPGIQEIALKPLTTVRGKLRTSLPGKTIEFSHVTVEVPPDSERPLALTSAISCGSLDGSFEFKVPPGEYVLDFYAHSQKPEAIFLHVKLPPRLSVDGNVNDIDLGTLDLQENPYSPQKLGKAIKEAKNSGTWRDYTQRFGEASPEWHITDSEGLGPNTRVADFRGKWLLIDFWGLGCAPCLSEDIPRLTAFYEKHKAQRSKFEIVGLCIDHAGELTTMQQLKEALKPIEQKVWKGKRIPFPVILDSTVQSWERFGLPGLGTVILIDPNGRLVSGGEAKLESILSE